MFCYGNESVFFPDTNQNVVRALPDAPTDAPFKHRMAHEAKKKLSGKYMDKAHKKLYNWQNILSPPHYRNRVHHPVEIICLYCGGHRYV